MTLVSFGRGDDGVNCNVIRKYQNGIYTVDNLFLIIGTIYIVG